MTRSLFAMLLAGVACIVVPAQAQVPASGTNSASASASNAEKPAPATKKTAGKKIARKAATPVVAEADEQEPDTAGSIVTEYKCELGNNLTVFANIGDDDHIALKWGKRLHRLERVSTTTGAVRFENRRYGLLWIGIPAKSMLLDSKTGHQLANECKSPEQLAAKDSGSPMTAILSR
jgi:hypothetical protein